MYRAVLSFSAIAGTRSRHKPDPQLTSPHLGATHDDATAAPAPQTYPSKWHEQQAERSDEALREYLLSLFGPKSGALAVALHKKDPAEYHRQRGLAVEHGILPKLRPGIIPGVSR
jgi:hypothetical protein